MPTRARTGTKPPFLRRSLRDHAAHVFALPVGAPDVVTGINTALGGFPPRQRWFAGKARTIANARVVDGASPTSIGVGMMPTIVDVDDTDGSAERNVMRILNAPDGRVGVR